MKSLTISAPFVEPFGREICSKKCGSIWAPPCMIGLMISICSANKSFYSLIKLLITFLWSSIMFFCISISSSCSFISFSMSSMLPLSSLHLLIKTRCIRKAIQNYETLNIAQKGGGHRCSRTFFSNLSMEMWLMGEGAGRSKVLVQKRFFYKKK